MVQVNLQKPVVFAAMVVASTAFFSEHGGSRTTFDRTARSRVRRTAAASRFSDNRAGNKYGAPADAQRAEIILADAGGFTPWSLLPQNNGSATRPFFEGWFVRIVDHQQHRSIGLILGSFAADRSRRAEGNVAFTQHYVAIALHRRGGALEAQHAFPTEVKMRSARSAGAEITDFVWRAPGFGELIVRGGNASTQFADGGEFGGRPGITLSSSAGKAAKNIDSSDSSGSSGIDGSDGSDGDASYAASDADGFGKPLGRPGAPFCPATGTEDTEDTEATIRAREQVIIPDSVDLAASEMSSVQVRHMLLAFITRVCDGRIVYIMRRLRVRSFVV